MEFDRPGEIVRVGEEFFLNDRGEHVLRLDKNTRPIEGVRLRELPPINKPVRGASARVLNLRCIAVRGSELIGLIGFQDGEDVRLGLGRLAFGDPPRAEIIQELPDPLPPASRLSMLAIPSIAAVGESIYMLRFEDRPHIARVHPAGDRLAAFPEGFDQVPILPVEQGPSADEAVFASLERASMPTGLLSHGAQLFLVTRRPEVEGGTRWVLHQIDPEKDVLIQSIRLPTTSNHIVVVPGSVDWAIVEKGPVMGTGRQEIRTVVLVPASWIEDPGGHETDLLGRCTHDES